MAADVETFSTDVLLIQCYCLAAGSSLCSFRMQREPKDKDIELLCVCVYTVCVFSTKEGTGIVCASPLLSGARLCSECRKTEHTHQRALTIPEMTVSEGAAPPPSFI